MQTTYSMQLGLPVFLMNLRKKKNCLNNNVPIQIQVEQELILLVNLQLRFNGL